LNNNRDL